MCVATVNQGTTISYHDMIHNRIGYILAYPIVSRHVMLHFHIMAGTHPGMERDREADRPFASGEVVICPDPRVSVEIGSVCW